MDNEGTWGCIGCGGYLILGVIVYLIFFKYLPEHSEIVGGPDGVNFVLQDVYYLTRDTGTVLAMMVFFWPLFLAFLALKFSIGCGLFVLMLYGMAVVLGGMFSSK